MSALKSLLVFRKCSDLLIFVLLMVIKPSCLIRISLCDKYNKETLGGFINIVDNLELKRVGFCFFSKIEGSLETSHNVMFR